MRCPFCGHADTRVLESRPTAEGNAIRRRRQCPVCEGRFTTYERAESSPLLVVKRDGSREAFDRQKLLRGILTACHKRPIPLSVLEQLVDHIEAALRRQWESEVPSRAIGEMVMERLRALDDVAYVRFASVYRDFRDAQAFREEIDRLLGRRTGSEPAGNHQAGTLNTSQS